MTDYNFSVLMRTSLVDFYFASEAFFGTFEGPDLTKSPLFYEPVSGIGILSASSKTLVNIDQVNRFKELIKLTPTIQSAFYFSNILKSNLAGDPFHFFLRVFEDSDPDQVELRRIRNILNLYTMNNEETAFAEAHRFTDGISYVFYANVSDKRDQILQVLKPIISENKILAMHES
jgi:hypothetical protein